MVDEMTNSEGSKTYPLNQISKQVSTGRRERRNQKVGIGKQRKTRDNRGEISDMRKEGREKRGEGREERVERREKRAEGRERREEGGEENFVGKR